MSMNDPQLRRAQLRKAPTGIDGLDAIMEGGFPAGRPTLLCGAAGCGKTLFGVTFLAEGLGAGHVSNSNMIVFATSIRLK